MNGLARLSPDRRATRRNVCGAGLRRGEPMGSDGVRCGDRTGCTISMSCGGLMGGGDPRPKGCSDAMGCGKSLGGGDPRGGGDSTGGGDFMGVWDPMGSGESACGGDPWAAAILWAMAKSTCGSVRSSFFGSVLPAAELGDALARKGETAGAGLL